MPRVDLTNEELAFLKLTLQHKVIDADTRYWLASDKLMARDLLTKFDQAEAPTRKGRKAQPER
jgi:hypothetical protein